MRMKLFFTVLLLLPITVMAQNDLPAPMLMTETEDGINFYALTEENELEHVGQLAADFSNERSAEAPWQLGDWLGLNLTLSPDGQRIAFTAHNRADHTGFFIYTLGDADVEARFVADFIPFATQLKWSPDSEAVMLEPIGCDCGPYKHPYPETYIYEIPTDSWRALTNTPDQVEYYFAWASDSQSVAYDGHGDGMVIIDRDGNERRLLVEASSQFPQGTNSTTCHFAWSDSAQRWYYEQGCLRRVDNPQDSVYSVNLDGDNRLEIDLPALFVEEFQIPEFTNPFFFVDIVALEATPSGLYAIVDTQMEVGEDVESFLRVIRIDEPGQAVTVLEIRDARSLKRPVFSPDFGHIALVGYYNLVVANVSTQQVIAQVELEEITTVARWLDAEQLLYSNGTEVWLLDTGDGSGTNLTASFDQPAWLLPQISSW